MGKASLLYYKPSKTTTVLIKIDVYINKNGAHVNKYHDCIQDGKHMMALYCTAKKTLFEGLLKNQTLIDIFQFFFLFFFFDIGLISHMVPAIIRFGNWFLLRSSPLRNCLSARLSSRGEQGWWQI